MKQRISFFAAYASFLYLFFIISRFVFLVFHFKHTLAFPFTDWIMTYWYGAKLDFSFVSYLLLIPVFFMIFMSFAGTKIMKTVFNIYTYFILFALSFLVIVDLELYRYWGFRLDSTPLDYLNSPREMFASISLWIVVRQLFLGAIIFVGFRLLYVKMSSLFLSGKSKGGWKSALLFIAIIPLLIIVMRGGRVTGLPVSVADVYFHKNTFMNHAAINLPWNIANSFYESSFKGEKIKFYEQERVDSICSDLFEEKGDVVNFLNNKRPNLIFVLLESFENRAVGDLDGNGDASPNFGHLVKEGVLFDNFYATGDRSNEAVVGMLSGFPSLQRSSIIYFPKKTKKLPFLSHILSDNGYTSSFLYGGSMGFANFNIYFHDAKFDELIYDKDFDKSTFSVWGAPDHIVFDRLFESVNNLKQPFFSMIFTLSSHRPFDVPMETVIEGEDTESLYYNSIYYTDKCFGDFIAKAKKTSWWDNTLVVALADHGIIINNEPSHNSPEHFHIPMLWLGGALAVRDTIVSTIGSQTDIAATVLSKFGINSDEFIFSKNILSTQPQSFAYYAYSGGIGVVADSSAMIFYPASGETLVSRGKTDTTLAVKGKAILQNISKIIW